MVTSSPLPLIVCLGPSTSVSEHILLHLKLNNFISEEKNRKTGLFGRPNLTMAATDRWCSPFFTQRS
jgi:hypothetical protein